MEDKEFITRFDNKEKFSEKEIRSLVWEMDTVEEIEGEDRRWSRGMQTIFKADDRYFSICWEKGLTEMQEDEYYDQPEEVSLIEETKTITVKNWVPVKGE